MSQPIQAVKRPRDTRIDLLRGLALAMIYINHVPGTIYEHYTSRNFGFSDAAEAFVMIAGISAALAYGRYYVPGKTFFMAGVWRAWGRVWMLYLVQMTIVVIVTAFVAFMLRYAQFPDMMAADGFRRLVNDPISVLIGLPTLGYQYGYINILPLYMVLLAFVPALLWLGQRWPLWTLAGSVALWFFAGYVRVNFPTYPLGGGWFLNPLSWQLIFVGGMLTGLGMTQDRRFVPVKPWLVALASAYLVLSLVWMQFPAVKSLGNAFMVQLSQLGAPRIITNFNKTYAEAPRLLHIFALAYVISVLPWFKKGSGAWYFEWLSVMGRQSLPIFALGTVLSFVGKGILRWNAPASGWLQFAVIFGGLAILIGFAFAREAAHRSMKSATAALKG